MWSLTLLPFAIQAIAMIFDEGYFHIRRGLPRWERIGHPLDTLTVLACLVWTLIIPFSPFYLSIYALLAIFSSIFVTKDEFVHKTHCPAAENWLHALLFILHPITLIMGALLWPASQKIDLPSWLTPWIAPSEIARLFLLLQFTIMTLFLFYQIIYWNYIRRENDQ